MLLCCAAALVACSEGHDSTTATTKRSADGYVFRLPNGWRDITKRANTGPLTYDRAVEARTGPPMNVTVIKEHLADLDEAIDDAKDLAEANAKTVGRTAGVPVRPLSEREIDGEPAHGYAFNPPKANNPLGRSVVYIALRNDEVFTVTLQSTRADARAAFEVLEQLLNSWRWKD